MRISKRPLSILLCLLMLASLLPAAALAASNEGTGVTGSEVHVSSMDELKQYLSAPQTCTITLDKEDSSIQVTPQVGIAAKAGGRVTFTASGGSGTYAWYYRNAGAFTWTKSAVTTNKFSILVGKDREVFCASGDARSPVVTATVGK